MYNMLANVRLNGVESSCPELDQSILPVLGDHTEIVDGSAEDLLSFTLNDKFFAIQRKFDCWGVTDTTQDQGGGVFIVPIIRGAEEIREKEVANEKTAQYDGYDLCTSEKK